MADFNTILGSEIFTFQVGPDKKPMKIHSGLVKALSEPLNVMVNGGTGGKMQDATQKQASLEDVDVQTFVLFCEFAYTGMYRAPAKVGNVGSGNTNAATGLFPASHPSHPSFSPFRPIPSASAQSFSFTSPQNQVPQNPINPTSQPNPTPNLWNFGTPSTSAKTQSPSDPYCHGCGSKNIFNNPCPPSRICSSHGFKFFCTRCGTETAASSKRCSKCVPVQSTTLPRDYPALGMPHTELREYLKILRPIVPFSNKLSCHVKLYVFANTFMIEPLKRLTLHQLHRDLEGFPLAQDIKEVVEMMTYTYDNTSEGGQGSSAVGFELRELVMAYAILHAGEFMTHQEFRMMIREGGELAEAFTMGMVGRLN